MHATSPSHRLDRRALLRSLGITSLGLLAAACAPAAPATPTSPPAAPKTASPTAPAATAPITAAAKPTPAQAAPTTAVAQTGQITFMQGSDPRFLDPFNIEGQNEVNAARQMIEKLVVYNPETKSFDGVLATEWKQLNDTTLQFKLRQGVTFSNGEPFDAKAALYSLEQLLKSKLHARWTGAMDHAEVVDSYTINLVNKRVSNTTLMSLHQVSWMVPPKYYADQGGDGFGKKPIGTGQFVFGDWQKDTRLTLKANPAYWGEKPGFGTLIFRPVPEPAARIAALQAGEADIIFDISFSDIPALQSNRNLTVQSVPGFRSMCVQLDNRYGLSEITKNRSVRRAFYSAIDADSIIKNVFNGQAKRLQGQVLPEEYFGFNPDLKAPAYDPDQAKRLLDEGGYGGGFEETFMVPSGRYVQDKEVGQVIADQLAKVGIKTKLQFLEVGDFFNRALGGKLGPISYIGTLSAPHAAFALTVDSCAYEASYMCDQTYDQAIGQATGTLDKDQEIKLYKQATQLAFDDPSRIYLWRTNDVYGVNNRVQNWRARSDQEIWFKSISVKA